MVGGDNVKLKYDESENRDEKSRINNYNMNLSKQVGLFWRKKLISKLYFCICICMYIYTSIYLYINKCIHIHTYIHIYIYIYFKQGGLFWRKKLISKSHFYTYMCIYVYIYVYVYTYMDQ
jgi:hypothetical protein